MNRNISYQGKTIYEMTINELRKQYKLNKIRFIYRTIFFILIAISITLYEPIATIIPMSFAIITGYWLIENNNAIRKEIENR